MDFFKHNSKRSPNSPLVKSPYLRLSVEFKKLSSKIEDIDLINTFAILKLGNQEKKTNIIRHISSPKWFEEFEFQVDNVKENKLLIEIFSTKIYSTTDAKIIGFQLIPIKVLEKQNMVGEKITLILKLILSSTNNFFSEDENNILHINRYDPLKYKVESREANLIHDKKNNNLDCPLIFLTFEYMNYFHLWKCNINIHSIIQRNNNKNQMNYFFRIFIKRNDGLQWFKEVTFEEIEELRNFLVMYVVELKNIPFPKKSVFRFIPFFKKYYSDDNVDVLIERKFFFDNFFEQISKNIQIYKFEEFNKFFSSNYT